MPELEQKITEAFSMDEINLISKLYNDLSKQSLTKFGIERRVFIEFTELPGIWAAKMFRFVVSLDRMQQQEI